MKKLIFLLKILLLIGFWQAISLPFSSDVGSIYSITEGFVYSTAEQAIHWNKYHWSVDYALPFWTPVYAPTDWYIVASYHDEMLNRFVNGQQVHYGWGWHVVIFSPSDEKIILLWHLSSLEGSIPIDFPVAKLNKNMKVVKYISNIANLSKQWLLEKFWKNWKRVKKWDLIGTVWNSGLGLWIDFVSPYDVPYYPEIHSQNSWDEPHIHMEVYYKKNIFSKKNKIDPYWIYKDASFYQKYFSQFDWTIFDFSWAWIEFAKYLPYSGSKTKLQNLIKNRKSN